jgi:hypothetical protein
VNHRRLDLVIARALRYGLQPGPDADAAACELAELAKGRQQLLDQARVRICGRLVERPSPVGERSRELLERALVIAAAANRSRAGSRAPAST